jgi:hypothetical protein
VNISIKKIKYIIDIIKTLTNTKMDLTMQQLFTLPVYRKHIAPMVSRWEHFEEYDKLVKANYDVVMDRSNFSNKRNDTIKLDKVEDIVEWATKVMVEDEYDCNYIINYLQFDAVEGCYKYCQSILNIVDISYHYKNEDYDKMNKITSQIPHYCQLHIGMYASKHMLNIHKKILIGQN